jgi:hypothetical protein
MKWMMSELEGLSISRISSRGTCRPDDKGEIQVEETTRVRVPMRGTGAEQSVVCAGQRTDQEG